MRKTKQQRGFTLAEVLIVIAILGVLAGVAIVGVPQYLRTMTKLEYDSYAREIFVAAQNHLTMAESAEYLGIGDGGFGESTEGVDKKGEYHLIFNGEDSEDSFDDNPLLNLMLPYGAIDDIVRTGGRYIIRYNKKSAQILDVFYWQESGGRFDHSYTNDDDHYKDLIQYHTNPDALKTYNYKNDATKGDNSVIGYYGGKGKGLPQDLKQGYKLESPTIEVKNEETLSVKVTDGEGNKAYLKLIITGVESKQSREIPLVDKNHLRKDDGPPITLDDISGNEHFYTKFCTIEDLSKPENVLIPGEDIEIQAIAYNNKELTNIAYSEKKVTSSLFATSVEKTAEDGEQFRVAKIEYMRHLENLCAAVSNFSADSSKIKEAEQVRDLSYPEGGMLVTNCNNTRLTESASFVPVTPPDGFKSYDGKKHSITGVVADVSGKDAGLFGELSGVDVKNLQLLDFSVTGKNAGALAGKVSGGTISNVMAKNSSDSTDINVTGTETAGGLIGSADDATVTACYSTCLVNGTEKAGGLLGNAKGATVTACYSGGHTANGTYTGEANVTGATAGGLIGSADDATVTACYSTCSAHGTATTGGLLGSGSGTVSNCYAAGPVSGGNAGAFAGDFSGSATQCQYYEIINPVPADPDEGYSAGYSYLAPLAGNKKSPNITPLDADTDTFAAFTVKSNKAFPFDKALEQREFRLKTVFDLLPDGSEIKEKNGDFIKTHYGDWPIPETLVISAEE